MSYELTLCTNIHSFKLLKDQKTPKEKKRDGIRFLQEYTNTFKGLQAYIKNAIYTTLIEHGLLEVLEQTIIDQDLETRKSSANIIYLCANHDAELIRTHIVKQKLKSPFFNNIITAIIAQSDTGVQEQLVDTLQILLDPDAIGIQVTALYSSLTGIQIKDDFLNLFYDDFIEMLVSPLTQNKDESKTFSSARCHVCNLLCFFVRSHTYRSRNFIIRNRITKHVLNLLTSHEKYLILGMK